MIKIWIVKKQQGAIIKEWDNEKNKRKLIMLWVLIQSKNYKDIKSAIQ